MDDAKIDNLAAQLGAVLVELARLGATVEGMRGEHSRSSIDSGRDLADHEVRLRALESHGTAAHRAQIDSLLQWRSRIVGWMAGASAAGGLSGAGLAVLAQHLLK